MSGEELGVSIVFALLGYWIVSFFLQRKPTPAAEGAPPPGQAWPQVLNIDANASVDQIRAAYQALISQYHSDKVAGLGPELREVADRKSKEITAAYREAMRSRDLGE
jgi:preprotein translocase subunit Sec63